LKFVLLAASLRRRNDVTDIVAIVHISQSSAVG